MLRGFEYAVGAAALMAMSVPALAKNVEADYDQVQAALQEAGYRAKIEGEGADRSIASGTSGYSFYVYSHGCDDAGKGCKTIRLYASFAPDKKPTLIQMNDYAADMRWGRIFLDKEGDPVIEMDVDLEDGGMSQELFVDNVEYWEAVMNAFAAWVFDNAES